MRKTENLRRPPSNGSKYLLREEHQQCSLQELLLQRRKREERRLLVTGLEIHSLHKVFLYSGHRIKVPENEASHVFRYLTSGSGTTQHSGNWNPDDGAERLEESDPKIPKYRAYSPSSCLRRNFI